MGRKRSKGRGLGLHDRAIECLIKALRLRRKRSKLPRGFGSGKGANGLRAAFWIIIQIKR